MWNEPVCPLHYVFEPLSGLCECKPRPDNMECEELILPSCVYARANVRLACSEFALRRQNRLNPLEPVGTCDCLLQCTAYLTAQSASLLLIASPHVVCLAPPLGALNLSSLAQLENVEAWQAPAVQAWRDSFWLDPGNSTWIVAQPAPDLSALILRRVAASAEQSIELVPLSLCEGNCSGHGFCARRAGLSPACVCSQRRSAADQCGSYTIGVHECPNACSHVGECVQGVCRCPPHRADIDCAMPYPPMPTRPAPILSPWPRVFVYPLNPPLSMSWVLYSSDGPYFDFGRATPLAFLNEVLRSPARVFDPSQADLFVIPMAGAYVRSRLDALGLLQTRWREHWREQGGRNHIWLPMVSDDGQGQYWGPPGWHWAAHHQLAEPANSTRLTCMGKYVSTCFRASFVVGRDIVLPPLPKPLFIFDRARLAPTANRTLFIFFSGTITGDESSCNVRGRMLHASRRWHADPNRTLIVNGFVEHDAETMRASVFCLAPPGKSGRWGFRSSMAVLSGCIPVYIADDRQFELEELLGGRAAMDRVAVVVSEDALDGLYERLEALASNSTELQRRQDELIREWRPLFDWGITPSTRDIFDLSSEPKLLDAVLATLKLRGIGVARLSGGAL